MVQTTYVSEVWLRGATEGVFRGGGGVKGAGRVRCRWVSAPALRGATARSL